ncbi:MAG: hypothetical protein K5829_06880 [Treponema sp.]|nr:hypothetical protein [Treponema sp.]
MKKIFSKSFVAVIVSAVIFQMPLTAQIKTTFTQEKRRSGEKPTGLVEPKPVSERNEVDIAMPKKTRGVERYNKLNIWGKTIPDSFLFYRENLNQKQKAVYDTIYKALMKNEEGASLPVGLTEDEFFDTMDAVIYDNPEAFWWDGNYRYWTNSDDTVTSFKFKNWLEDSEIEQKYEEFWNATSPILFYASKLPDEMSKIKYVHDYLCLSIEYDDESYESGNTGGKLQTAYSGAVEYKTVCAGYSTLFEYYLQNLGIPCTYISSGSHAWNFLKVNGQYYQTDVTWNDTELIPSYYNLTHEEMQKIKSHMPKAISKKVIDAHPSTGNQMSYLQYFGALLEGSPYTYKELSFYDPEKSTSQPGAVKIYKNNPEILRTVRTGEDLLVLINDTYGTDYTKGTVINFFVPSREEMDALFDRLYKGDLYDYYLRGSRSYAGNGVVYELTLDAPKNSGNSSSGSSASARTVTGSSESGNASF